MSEYGKKQRFALYSFFPILGLGLLIGGLMLGPDYYFPLLVIFFVSRARDGVFTSEVADKIGTITYTIGNIHKPNDPLDPFDDEFWGGHLKVCEGTGYFEGLKGQGVLNFSEMLFELYLDYNPWG